MIEFVQSLHEIKKRQQKWEEHDLDHRKEVLKIFSSGVFLYYSEKNHSPFCQKDILFGQRIAAQLFSEQCKPELVNATGIITVVAEETSSLSVIFSQVLSALLAGNGVYVFFPEQVSAELYECFKLAAEEIPLFAFIGNEQLMQVMIAHPSVAAVAFNGTTRIGEKIATQSAGLKKKWQVSIGYHNAALVLPGADLNLAAMKIAEAILIGEGKWPINVNEVFVVEVQLKEFSELLLQQINAQIIAHKIQFNPQTKEKVELLRQCILAERGKLLLGADENQPLVVDDFSHCSPLHQESLEAPVLFVQPVKYVHEMVKWVKAFDHSRMALIFAPDEKVIKFGSQLPLSKVVANGWIDKLTQIPIATGRNLIGVPDQSPFGGFYSNQKNFDGLESKF